MEPKKSNIVFICYLYRLEVMAHNSCDTGPCFVGVCQTVLPVTRGKMSIYEQTVKTLVTD